MLYVDDVVVNPKEAPLLPARQERSLSELGLGIVAADWGESTVTGTSVKTPTGTVLVDRESKERAIVLTMEVREDADVSLPEAVRGFQFVLAALQRGTFIRRDHRFGAFGSTLFRVAGEVSAQNFGGWQKGESPDVTLTMAADFAGYSTEEREQGPFTSAVGARHLILDEEPSPGTANGLWRGRITNNGSEDWRGLILSRECEYAPEDLEDPTARPHYLARDLTPKGGAVVTGGPSAPEVRAVGAVSTGAGAVSPPLPAGTAKGDLLIMVAESGGATAGAEANTPLTAAGWSSPPAPYADQKKGNTRLTILYRVATGGDPTTTNDTGDHQIAKIIGIQAGTFDADEPFNTAAIGTQAATKAVSIPGGTTTLDNCLILACATGNLPDATGTAEFGAPTNASLSSLIERIDNTATAGDGGALYAATGVKASKGAYSATTLTAVTEAERAVASLAINAPLYVEHNALTAGWITILDFEIDGVGHMTHRGPRRPWIRIEQPGGEAGDVQLQLLWRALGASRWEDQAPIISTPVVDSWIPVDLGLVRPQDAVLGDQRWEGRLMARTPGGSGAIRVWDVYPLSTEQYVVKREPEDPPVANAQKTQSPTVVTNNASVGSIAWTNPGNAKASDNSYASAKVSSSGTTNALRASKLEYGLPVGARPVSVVGVIEKSSPEGSLLFVDYSVRLVVGGVAVGPNKAQDLPKGWPTTDAPYIYEWTSEEIAALKLTRSQVNAEDFGLEIAAQLATLSEREARVDRMGLTLQYSEQGEEEDKVCFASRTLELRSDRLIRQHPTDEVWGTLVLDDGFLPHVPSGGLEGRPVRTIAIPSAGDLAQLPDGAAPSLEATTFSRDGYHLARETS